MDRGYTITQSVAYSSSRNAIMLSASDFHLLFMYTNQFTAKHSIFLI